MKNTTKLLNIFRPLLDNNRLNYRYHIENGIIYLAIENNNLTSYTKSDFMNLTVSNKAVVNSNITGIIIDLHKLESIKSEFLGILFSLQLELKKLGKTGKLIINERVKSIMDLIGLSNVYILEVV